MSTQGFKLTMTADSSKNQHIPVFYVTQEEYDQLTDADKASKKYEISDDRPIPPPQFYTHPHVDEDISGE